MSIWIRIKKLFFYEVNPLIKLARRRPVEESDFIELDEDLNPRSTVYQESFLKWENSKSLIQSIFPLCKGRLWIAYSWYFVGLMMSLLSPLVMNRFLTSIKDVNVSDEALRFSIILGVGLGFTGLLTGFAYQQYFRHTLASYQILVNLINKRIFNHSLSLGLLAKQKVQLGDVVNHMSSDSESVADVPLVAADMVWAVVSILAGMGMLFYFLGASAWAALVLMVTLWPLTKKLAANFFHLDEQMMSWRDQRVSLLGQTLNAIRIVKYFVWEKSVKKEIHLLRDEELKARTRLAKSEVLATMTYMVMSAVLLFVVLLVHSLRGLELTVPLVFTCLSIFALLEEPFGNLSGLISRWTAARVGAQRIVDFLKTDKVPDSKNKIAEKLDLIELKNKTWGYQEPLIKNLNLLIRKGQSVAVIGPVGSGKSSLLLGLLGELKSFEGQFLINGQEDVAAKIAYVPQESYILSGTLLENVVFGNTVTNQSVRKALHLSCLDKDVRHFEDGLRTEIGEKGVNLSGGQKQRVALARASLQEADLILLDDPLSAVDGETERLLCDRLIFGEWKHKTRIVVTHRLESLRLFDQILFLDQGQVKALGSFADLEQQKFFQEFIKDHVQGFEESQVNEKMLAQAKGFEASEFSAESFEETGSQAQKLVQDEDRATGTVKSSLYWDYIKSLGGEGVFQYWIVVALFLVAAGSVLIPLVQKWWLGYFTSNVSTLDSSFGLSVLASVGVYGFIGVVILVVATYSHILWLQRGLLAGQVMHEKMLNAVLGAPVSFFDSTPVGRILQRFSRDIETVDIHLQRSFESNVNCLIQILTALGLILVLMPVMVLVILPIGLVYYRIQSDYRSAAREVKRLDSITRSPRYAHFKESLQGLTVIRAFHKQDWYFSEFLKRLERNQKAFFNHYMINRWFSSRVPIVGGFVAMFSGLFVVLAVKQGDLSQATAGLLMTYAMSFWAFLNWGIRMFADVESRMTSIERLHFFMNLPQEKAVTLVPQAVSSVTASAQGLKGHIEFKNVQLRYAPQFPLILKNLSFEIPAGARVGLIGRTGSGKSTILQALYRFVELEGGEILLDGVNIASIPLPELRKQLAIIPQDPVLFIGSIRSNLDRYNEFSDQDVLLAMERAGLKEMLAALPLGLLSPVVEGGANFSQGQRQLMCMARALLTNAKVIIMDEATASVDVHNDDLIQKVIRESFKGITMLIVAHRLSTIEDADLTIELEVGELKSRQAKSAKH